MKEIELDINTKNLKIFSLILILLTILFFEVVQPLNTRINFGDEGFHTTLIKWISSNKEMPTWLPVFYPESMKSGYPGAFLYHLTAAGLMILGFQEIFVRFLVPFCTFLSGISIFILVKRIFNENTGWLASLILVTFPSIVTYSVFLYRDAFFTLFMTLFYLTFILSFKENSKKYFLLSSVFGAFAILSKSAGFGILFFLAFVFFYEILKEKQFLTTFKKYLIWFLILAAILTPVYLRNIYYYHALCYLPYSPKFFEKVPLLSSKGCTINFYQEKYQFAGRVEQVGTEANVFSIGLVSYIDFAYGNLMVIAFPFFLGIFYLLSSRTKIDILFLLALLSVLPVFYVSVGRAEDTARYILGWAPLIAITSAIGMNEIVAFLNKQHKYLGLLFSLIVVFYCIFGGTFIGTNAYGFLNRLSVLLQVRKFSPSFFEACDWVKQNLDKNARLLTIWAYRAAYNCERNVMGSFADIFLSRDLNYTLKAAKLNNITHIFIQKFSIDPENKHYSEHYDLEFVEFLEAHPDHFVKVYENGASLEQCKQYWQLGYQCDGNIIYEIKL